MGWSGIQRKGKGAASVTSLSIGSGDGWATPTSGNLLVVTANSDSTVSTPSGYTLGPSVIDGNGAYIFYKISDGSESTVTITPGGSANTAMTAAEYSGNAASPFDVSNTSTIAGSAGTITTSVSVTTTADGDLVIAAALLHSAVSANPTSPTWTNSFVNQISASSGAAVPTCDSFVAELIVGAAGAYSTACSWTNSANDRQELVIAFTVATTTPDAGGFIESGFHPGRGPTNARFYQTPKSFDVTQGQSFTQSFAGSVTPTGNLTKQDNKALAGSSTPTGALAKQAAKALAGSVTATGTLTKLVAKALAGLVTPTGALTTIKVVLRSFAGSVTPTGALTRQANKALSGSSTPQGALTKAVSKALAGAVSAVGSLAKLISKPFAGGSSPTGALTAINQGATENATSSPTIAAGPTSSPSVSAGRSSAATVSTKATSTPSVSDG